MKKVMIAFAAMLISLSANAQSILGDSISLTARVGYSLGGTAPVGLPRTIRHMNSYTLMPNFQFGIDAERRISPLIGVMLGLRLENKGMQVDARVKNYHMAIEQGTQHLEGQFTGDVKTKVNEWMFTVPVMAAFQPECMLLTCSRASLKAMLTVDIYAWEGLPGPKSTSEKSLVNVEITISATICAVCKWGLPWVVTGHSAKNGVAIST